VDERSKLIFCPSGVFLYAGQIHRDKPNDRQQTIRLSKINIQSGDRAYLATLSPIVPPEYCNTSATPRVSMVLKDDEIHFLVSVEYKVMLAKIDFDGTVKWKVIASLPGPPISSPAIALSGWNSKIRGNRLDLVLGDEYIGYPTVINTWEESPDEWDEVRTVEHDESLG
jgi:hypothetical protein